MVWLLFLWLSPEKSECNELVLLSRYGDLAETDRRERREGRCEVIKLSGEITGSDNSVEIRSRWTEDSLYLYYQVLDKDLRAHQREKDHPRLFLDDMVEVLIDPENNRGTCWRKDDIVYHVNLLGVKKDDRGTAACASDARWDGAAVFRITLDGTLNDTTDVDVGYVIEIAIPWKELGVDPYAGRKLAINFANGDNDGRGRQLFDWAGAWPLRSPYAFGDLILSK